MKTNRQLIPLLFAGVILASGCISMVGDQLPEEREEQLDHLLNQVNCLDKSIEVEHYDAESASVQNTGDSTIEDIQLSWAFEDGETVNRTANDVSPGQATTKSTSEVGELENFDANIVGCILK